MLQDFAVGLWFRRLQKRVRKIRFFPYCIQDSPISSFHLQKSRLYALIFWFYPLLCKEHLSIFDLCWGDFTTPPSYYIGRLFQIFNHPRGPQREKRLFSTPYRSYCSLLRREPGSDHRGHLIPWTGKQAIKAPPPQSPTRFSITPLISTSNWTHIPLSYCQIPRFYGRPEVLFRKAKKDGGGVPHYRMAKGPVHSNVRPGPLSSRNFQGNSRIKSRQRATNDPLQQGSLGYVLFGTGSELSCIATSFIYN